MKEDGSSSNDYYDPFSRSPLVPVNNERNITENSDHQFKPIPKVKKQFNCPCGCQCLFLFSILLVLSFVFAYIFYFDKQGGFDIPTLEGINIIKLKYNILNSDSEIKLYDDSNTNLKDLQCKIKIDKKEQDCIDYYKFEKTGEHNVEIQINGTLNSFKNFFASCGNLSYVDLSNINTNEIKNMAGLFKGCSSLISATLDKINTSLVTDMSKMFYECESITSLNLSTFNTNNVVNMNKMFSACSSLNYIDIRSFNTSSLDETTEIFSGLPKTGKLFYNSKIFDYNFTGEIPEKWKITDESK